MEHSHDVDAEVDTTIYQSENGEEIIHSPIAKVENQLINISPKEKYIEESNSYLSVPNQGRTLVFNSSNLKINPLNLLCMNINAYMGGVKDMWNNAKQEAPFGEYLNQDTIKKYTLDQNIDDGILEFLSFTSRIKFGMLERMCRGWGKRMCQGKYCNFPNTHKMFKLQTNFSCRQWSFLHHFPEKL